jgi:hypothetical protein
MKDQKGHGSNTRGMSVPDRHQHNIARDTVKNPMKGAFLGGMTAEQGEALLRGKFGYSDSAVAALKGDDKAAAAKLREGAGPKSSAPPVHPAMTPVQSENAPFTSRLGKSAGHSYLDPHDPRAKGK